MRARFIDFPKYSCIIGRIWLTLTKSLESVVFIEKAANFSLKLLIFKDFCKYNLLIIKYLTIEFYFLSSTKAEIIEKFNVSESWIFVMAKKNKIPKTFNRGKTYWSKKHVDAYFSSKAPDADIPEWYSVQEVQDKFQMSLNAIYSFVYKNVIPKKKVGITVYYSKKHFDIAKGIRQAEEPKYYTVREAMEKFKITRDQLYHYTKYHQIPKIKKGKYTLISKPELDNLFEDPIIE